MDIEARFSDDPGEVAEFVDELAGAGAVGVNIEDGRADGTLAPVARQVELITTVTARVPEVFVNTRTDTYWLGGVDLSLADPLARVETYRVGGADGVFVPVWSTPDSIRTVVAAAGDPLNVLYLPGRHTIAHLSDLGVRRISCGSLLFRAALHAAVSTVRAIARNEPVSGDISGYAEVNDLATR